MRKAEIERNTSETKIKLSLSIDGKGERQINTGIGFFDHMLELFAKHGLFDLKLTVEGDTNVDEHHTIEDTGIALGEAFAAAAGDKSGISRYASQFLPMDEALAFACVDFSGRPYLRYEVYCPDDVVGGINPQIFEEFFRAFSSSARMTLHIELICGTNTHHILESVFKAAARTIRLALEKDPRVSGVPSTKGVL
jgi:imidazoleglycerol-phosphate dehydratase